MGEPPLRVCCYQRKDDRHDNHDQDLAADLQALFVCKCDARVRRRNSTRYSSDAICSGSKGIAKNSQVPGNSKGKPDVQQLQTLCGSERLPDRRWSDQSKRLVHRLSEGVARSWRRSTVEGGSDKPPSQGWSVTSPRTIIAPDHQRVVGWCRVAPPGCRVSNFARMLSSLIVWNDRG